MKALTIWQPHAALVMAGAKPDEYRSKPYRCYSNAPRPGQRIVIHAGARPMRPHEIMDILARIARKDSGLREKLALPVLEALSRTPRPSVALPFSVALGTAIIGEPREMPPGFKVPGFSKQPAVLWAWPFTDVEPFPEPVPMRGFQGFWNYPERSEAA